MSRSALPDEPVRLGLIGWPLGHSLSPLLHEAALASAGLRGEYRLYPLSPEAVAQGELRHLLNHLRRGGLRGLNVTIPHKQAVMSLVDHLSPVARAVGAANTLHLDSGGRLMGDNTDVPGFLHDIRRLVGDQVGSALVLGAGGSARAVVYALAQAGWRVHVAARRAEQSAALVRELAETFFAPPDSSAPRPASPCLTAVEMALAPSASSSILTAARDCDLLVNTTPLGMTPNPDTCPWPDDWPLPDHAAVYDLVYNPPETVLVRRARQAGLPACTGAGMLIAQAALAFSIWTGLEPPFQVMSEAYSSKKTASRG